MAKIEEETNAVTEQQTQATEQPNLAQLLQRLEDQDQKIQELSEQQGANKFKKQKERYIGPRHYSYKLRGGVPVLTYVSDKKDKNRDWLYKDGNSYVNNQILKLSLADGKTARVDVIDFLRSFERSDKVPCGVVQKEDGSTAYAFKTEKYGEIEVLENVING